jgi:hypothetical protein
MAIRAIGEFVRVGATRPPHTGEAIQAGAAQHREQDRLGLVVHGVPGQDAGREDPVTRLAGPGLQVGAGRNGHRSGFERRPVGRRRRSHHRSLSVRAGPQTVVDMNGQHVQAGPGG